MSLPLLHVETLGNGRVKFDFPALVVTFPSCISQVLTLRYSTKKFKPHAYTHHTVTLVIIAMSTLCHSIVSHATLILYHHASMQTTLISCALWLPQV